ncbi:MAG: sugar ABC transporter ATP-binding protein [Syntrophomonadaceae bacterium]|nr:sugar ABC transporter ATP-binding protein [Syntrophomonadaceae bacterium]
MQNEFVLELRGVSKSFPGVKALNGVDFTLRRGEVHCLIGENGAGKSTLIKIISGAHSLDSGEIIISGNSIIGLTANKALELGVSVIYQEMNLIPQLSVAENIFLGHRSHEMHFGIVDWKEMISDAKEILSKLGVDINPSIKVKDLSIAKQQMVEIGKSLALKKDILIMDEPTASLTKQDADVLFQIIDSLTSQGVAIIYISHRLEELPIIADRVSVLRDGYLVSTFDWGVASNEEIIKMMVGRDLKKVEGSKRRSPRGGEPLLSVRDLSKETNVQNASFHVHKGEIIGFAGLVGSGRTELMKLIFGAEQSDSGEIYFDGTQVNFSSPVDAVKHGIGMLSEDRKQEGLVLGLPICQNVTLANLKAFTKFGVIDQNFENKMAQEQVQSLDISTPSIEQKARYLSGGNQQKVVLAKWLVTKCQLLIFDEPTRGIDVGAKEEIYAIMEHLVSLGVAIIMVSSDLPEVLRMSDRIYVMSEGRIVSEVLRERATQENLMSLMLGGRYSVAQSS